MLPIEVRHRDCYRYCHRLHSHYNVWFSSLTQNCATLTRILLRCVPCIHCCRHNRYHPGLVIVPSHVQISSDPLDTGGPIFRSRGSLRMVCLAIRNTTKHHHRMAETSHPERIDHSNNTAATNFLPEKFARLANAPRSYPMSSGHCCGVHPCRLNTSA